MHPDSPKTCIFETLSFLNLCSLMGFSLSINIFALLFPNETENNFHFTPIIAGLNNICMQRITLFILEVNNIIFKTDLKKFVLT